MIKTEEIILEENFNELLEKAFLDFKYKEGQIIKGTVLSIVNDTVVVDVGLKSEGRIPIKEFHSPGEEHNVKVGEKYDVYLEKLENKEGEALLSRDRARKEESWNNLEKIQDSNQQVMGIITERVKGGFAVDIDGALAFLPGSQVDLKPIKDISPLLNKPQPMIILKMDKLRGNIVVSRRALLEESRKADRSKLLSDISEGDKLKGLIKNITDYGVFVDLGGMDGLIHVTDLSWERVNHPSEKFKVGDDIEVIVTKYDKENNRISLGLKQLTEDPWKNVDNEYKVGSIIKSKISNIADYGAFVQLERGVEGLIHNSELSWVNKSVHPNNIVSIGEELEVMILEIDHNKRRISLGRKQCIENPWKLFDDKNKKGDVVEGKIKNLTDFGIFVELSNDLDGLIHLSDISWEKSERRPLRIIKLMILIKFKILEIDLDKERVSLGIKQLSPDPSKSDETINKVVTGIVSEIEKDKVFVKFDKDKNGFIKRTNLAKSKTEQNTERFAVKEKIDAKVIKKLAKDNLYELSVKDLEIQEEKKHLKSMDQAPLEPVLGILLVQPSMRTIKRIKKS